MVVEVTERAQTSTNKCFQKFNVTAWKVSKCGVFSGPYFPVFGLNTGKYGPESPPYLDTCYAVREDVMDKMTRGV